MQVRPAASSAADPFRTCDTPSEQDKSFSGWPGPKFILAGQRCLELPLEGYFKTICLAQTPPPPRAALDCRSENLPPGAPPISISSIDGGMAYLYLEYISPGSITTYSTDLDLGLPGQGLPTIRRTHAEVFSRGIAKVTLPLFVAFMLKKARCRLDA